jgi:hypothetical protein
LVITLPTILSLTTSQNGLPQINPTEKHRWLKQRFLATMSKPEIRNFKITDVSTGNIVAWARWGFPYSFSEEERVERGREKEEKERKKREGTYSEWPAGSNLEVCEGKFGALDRIRNQNVDWGNTYGQFELLFVREGKIGAKT